MSKKKDGNYSLQWQDEAEAVWQQLENKLGDIDNRDYLPSSADLGVDIVESLFEIDIARIIEQLQENIETCTNEELKISVTPVLEVLIGFSEIGNMKGLKSIVDTTFAALAGNPHQTQQIVKYLINDLVQARDDVLSGSSTQGGKPSPELEKLAHNAREGVGELVEGDNLFHPDSENGEDSSLLDFADLASEINSNFDQEGEENIFDVSLDSQEFNFTPESDDKEESTDLSGLIEESETEDIFANFSDESSNQEENYPDLDIFMDNIFGEENQEEDSVSSQQKELQAQSYKFYGGGCRINRLN